MLLKIKWILYRSIFAFFALIAIGSGGLICYSLGPLYSWFFFNDFNCLRYRKYIYPIIFAYIRFFKRCINDSKYHKMFSVPFSAPPFISPVINNLRIKDTWTGASYDCNGCIDCCRKIKCPLLDVINKKCLSYGSFYWQFFSCGRYPVNKYQIEYYNCPKWEFIEKHCSEFGTTVV